MQFEGALQQKDVAYEEAAQEIHSGVRSRPNEADIIASNLAKSSSTTNLMYRRGTAEDPY
jgi:hypothetical protein